MNVFLSLCLIESMTCSNDSCASVWEGFCTGIVESLGLSYVSSSSTIVLSPAWDLVERNPRLWRLMRRTLRANLLVAALGIAARLLLKAVDIWTSSSAAPPMRRTATRGLAQLLIWLVQLGGQWPLYITFQIVGLVWYSQLYVETWTVRKGFVIRNASLPSLSPEGGDSPKLPATTLWMVLGLIRRRAGRLILLLLRCKEAPQSEHLWIVGDKVAAASLQPARSLTERIESASEVMFKAVATFLFALMTAFLERVLWQPFPLGLLLGLALNALLYAFYVFDYRYACQSMSRLSDRVSLKGQVAHFESRWVYHVGYGLGTTILTYVLVPCFGSVVAVCVTSVVYAWHVVCSGYAQPLRCSTPLPIFRTWFALVDFWKRWGADRVDLWWRLALLTLLLSVPLYFFFFL